MRIGYPIASTESGEKGLLWSAQKPTAAAGYPIDFEEAAEFEFLPQGRRVQREMVRISLAGRIGRRLHGFRQSEWRQV